MSMAQRAEGCMEPNPLASSSATAFQIWAAGRMSGSWVNG